MTKNRKFNLFSGLSTGYNELMNYRIGFFTSRIGELRQITSKDDKKGQKKIAVLSNGVIPDDELDNFGHFQKENKADNEPLSDTKIASFNNWFALHPEKVAGQEVITSSLEFPITIKGARRQIDEIFSFLDKSSSSDLDFELEAGVLELELKLLEFKNI